MASCAGWTASLRQPSDTWQKCRPEDMSRLPACGGGGEQLRAMRQAGGVVRSCRWSRQLAPAVRDELWTRRQLLPRPSGRVRMCSQRRPPACWLTALSVEVDRWTCTAREQGSGGNGARAVPSQ